MVGVTVETVKLELQKEVPGAGLVGVGLGVEALDQMEVTVVVGDAKFVTLLQDLQHMRRKSGREQWRFSSSLRQSTERSP